MSLSDIQVLDVENITNSQLIAYIALAGREDGKLIMRLAENPNLTGDMINLIVGADHVTTWQWVNHPNVTNPTRHKFAVYNGDSIYAFAKRGDLTDEDYEVILSWLDKQTANSYHSLRLFDFIINNPSTPSEVLEYIQYSDVYPNKQKARAELALIARGIVEEAEEEEEPETGTKSPYGPELTKCLVALANQLSSLGDLYSGRPTSETLSKLNGNCDYLRELAKGLGYDTSGK